MHGLWDYVNFVIFLSSGEGNHIDMLNGMMEVNFFEVKTVWLK